MSNSEGMNEPKHTRRGFASMTKERVREIGRMGGLANSEGRHRFTKEEASRAGKKGGLACAQRRAERAVELRALGQRIHAEMAVTTGTEDEISFEDVMP